MTPPPLKAAVHVRAARRDEVPALAALVGAAFVGEGAGLGMGQAAWTAFLADQFAVTPLSHIGVAHSPGGGGLLGAVVLRTAAAVGEGTGSGWAAAARAGGLRSAARLALRDALLPETVQPGEALVEYLAVSPAARRRGVAAALLGWAAAAVAAGAVVVGGSGSAARPPRLGLWVAASNAPARALYVQAGFKETESTQCAGACTRAACAAFLGEAAWVRMEVAVGKASLLLAPGRSLPSSPRLASYRPAAAA